MLYSIKYNLQSPLHHCYSQSCTIWGYNNVNVLNIKNFLSNFWVNFFWVFLNIPRENGEWLRFKCTQKYFSSAEKKEEVEVEEEEVTPELTPTSDKADFFISDEDEWYNIT